MACRTTLEGGGGNPTTAGPVVGAAAARAVAELIGHVPKWSRAGQSSGRAAVDGMPHSMHAALPDVP